MGKALTEQQIKLAEGVLAGLSAEKAAIAAGYSARSARTVGPTTLRTTAVQEYLATRRKPVQQATDTIQQRLLKELELLALSDPAAFYRIDEDGQPVVDFRNATPEQQRALTGVQTKRRKVYNKDGEVIAEELQTKYGVADKTRNIELYMRHLGMLKNEEVKVTVDISDRLLNARRRMLNVTRGLGNSSDDEQGGGGTGV